MAKLLERRSYSQLSIGSAFAPIRTTVKHALSRPPFPSSPVGHQPPSPLAENGKPAQPLTRYLRVSMAATSTAVHNRATGSARVYALHRGARAHGVGKVPDLQRFDETNWLQEGVCAVRWGSKRRLRGKTLRRRLRARLAANPEMWRLHVGSPYPGLGSPVQCSLPIAAYKSL